MDQFTRQGVPVRDNVESVDCREQVSMLLPCQVIILIELLELSSTLKQRLLEHLGEARGMYEPNVTITCGYK